MGRIAFIIVLLLPCLVSLRSSGQDRCGAVAGLEKMKAAQQVPEDDQVFEDWLRARMQHRVSTQAQRTSAGPYQVPVVVHVVHNGEPQGSGTNISDAQILSQIRVLNEDFRRMNNDAVNTPPEFAAVAGSMDIEFVLARQDPEGLATSGIVRVRGSKDSWSADDDYELKSQSYWPSEDYFNIWVCNLTTFLGTAQFPESDLPGLGNSSTNALTDGVVIWYRAFGSIDDDDGTFDLAPDYDKGRTATHETGHFFGLRHIWGDDGSGCSGTDHVADTPNQGRSTISCPEHPKNDACSDVVMFQNYMDYTDDPCMNLFTQGQISRMATVIENSPRRVTLLTSNGLEEPVPVPNDLGIRKIITPRPSHCSTTLTPTIEVRNYGSNTVTSARIRFSVNGSVVETKDAPLALSYLEITTVTFEPVLITPGVTSILFEIILTNGVTDGNGNNNDMEAAVFVPESIPVPFAESMESLPPGWIIQNPDQQIQWQLAPAPHTTEDNQALMMNFSDYDDSFGEIDILLSPVFDLSSVSVASVIFDRAYAQYQGSRDGLKVVVLRDCQLLSEGTVVFDRQGAALATAPDASTPFFPKDASEWKRELINLDAFIGESNLQLAFVAVSDWGNNLFIDNISLIVSIIEDIALTEVASPSLVTCDASPEPELLVQNSGNVTISTFDIRYMVNDGPWQTHPVTGLNLESGMEMTITMPEIGLEAGANMITIDLTAPNGKPDLIPSNDSIRVVTVVNNARDRIPLRENFDDMAEDDWTFINPGGGMNWQATQTNFNTSVFFDSYNNTDIADEAWLVSPVLDFSGAAGASMVFDLSHRSRQGRQDELKIMVSTDCGNTFTELNTSFNAPNESQPWEPESSDDWQQDVIIDLQSLAGFEEGRVAFVVRNRNGNNLYIDNLEFFTTSIPNLTDVAEPYAIYGYDVSNPSLSVLRITFNLEERVDVFFSVVDVMGRSFATGLLADVLNQTYPVPLGESLASGVYVVRLRIGDTFYSERVLITR